MTILARVSYPVSITVVNAALAALLAQDPPNDQGLGSIVIIDGTDKSDVVESVTTATDDSSAMGTCEIRLASGRTSDMATGATVQVYDVFEFEGGRTSIVQIFSGVARKIKADSTAGSEATTISAEDLVVSKLSQAPHNTEWTGTANNLVADELTAAGLDVTDVDFPDYTLPSAQPLSQYQTVRDLITAIASVLAPVTMWVGPTGVLSIRDASANETAQWTVGREGYSTAVDDDDDDAKYSSYTVMSPNGLSKNATGTGTIVASETTPFSVTEEQLQAKADAVIDRTERKKRTLEMGANPLAKVGELVEGIEHVDGTTYDGRVMSVRHVRQWPGGGWTTVKLEVVPA